MNRWEYDVLHVEDGATAEDMRDTLNDMGHQGWELVATPEPVNAASPMLLIFKRPAASAPNQFVNDDSDPPPMPAGKA